MRPREQPMSGLQVLRNALCLSVLVLAGCHNSTAAATRVPDAKTDAPLAQTSSKATAIFAGGCFWGTQSVFQRVKGVTATTAGYAGGAASTATYEQVTTE